MAGNPSASANAALSSLGDTSERVIATVIIASIPTEATIISLCVPPIHVGVNDSAG
jgi:hypothetical protein